MKIVLLQKKPNRLFTFGCSFTNYYWATWANILAYDLDCEFYNFGKIGAGNYYISNQVSQANNIYKFNENDLVLISWTNIFREDRWLNSEKWFTPGNIFNHDKYLDFFLSGWSNETHFALRDFSLIQLITEFLKNRTNFHMIKMVDLNIINQWGDSQIENKNTLLLYKNYEEIISLILPSFYHILWNNNIKHKFELSKREISRNFLEGHPSPLEHLYYMTAVFNYTFSQNTINSVHLLNNNLNEFLKYKLSKYEIEIPIYKLPKEDKKFIIDNFILRKSDDIHPNIL